MNYQNYAPETSTITILLDFTLKHSYFRFMEQHYIQLTGTSMGGRYAPPYTNLFMGIIEDNIIQNWTNHILLWKRFIDDIFIIFHGNEQDVLALKTFTRDRKNKVLDASQKSSQSAVGNITEVDKGLGFITITKVLEDEPRMFEGVKKNF